MDRVKRIWYLSPMRAAKVQASLHIRAVSPEPPLLAHRNTESRGTFRQKARSLAPLNDWACAFKICHHGMLEDTNSLDGANMASIKATKMVSTMLIFVKFLTRLTLPFNVRVKRICVFEHSVMTNFNCACPVIQRGQGSGFLSEGSS